MLVTYFVNFRKLNDHLFGKELFIRKLLSVYVFSYFPLGFEGRMWDLIVSVPDHCLSFYFPLGGVPFKAEVIGTVQCSTWRSSLSFFLYILLHLLSRIMSRRTLYTPVLQDEK